MQDTPDTPDKSAASSRASAVVVHEAAAAVLAEEPVTADLVIDGQPVVGHLALWEKADGRACGIWAHSVGASRDVEVDETFVVLSGRAIIESDGRRIEIGPGDVGVLAAGAETVWTILEPLRKVYITGPTGAGAHSDAGTDAGHATG